jgi:branched-chain amino acid transport system ATP-binding protein
MQAVMGLSDRLCVLDRGAVIARGVPNAVAADPAVIEAYLGAPDAAEKLWRGAD